MAIRYIDKNYGATSATAIANDATGRAKVRNLPDAAGIAADLVDFDLKYNRNDTIVALADTSSAQTFTNKTLTSPIINGSQSGVSGANGSAVTISNNKTLTDNTVTDFYTVTVPNIIAGGSIDLLVSSTLGDGDSTDTARYTIGISRITGAATKAVASAKSIVGATAGAGANAVITATVSAMAGAVGAAQTFTVTVKNARSAGAADNHKTTTVATLLSNVGGITMAVA